MKIILKFTDKSTGVVVYECQKEDDFYYSKDIEKARVYDKIGADIILALYVYSNSKWKRELIII